MIPIYDEKKDNLYIIHKQSQHFPPHMHETPELIYITNGTLELGIDENFFHMEKGDFAIVFPNTIHHYQVFSPCLSSALYIYPALSITGQFQNELQKYVPKNPVISGKQMHADIKNAIITLEDEKNTNPIIEQAYVQIILGRCMPMYELEERKSGQGDLIYRMVSYVAAHFKEDISLDKLAKSIGANKFSLSRVFSSVFHTNFNQYLNEQRINFACSLLEYSDCPITEICLEAGFQSQRTFNRVFQEMYHMTPRDYRNRYKKRFLMNKEEQRLRII